MALVYFVLFVTALVSVSASEAWGSQEVGSEHWEDPTNPKYHVMAMKAYKKYYWDRYHKTTELMSVRVLKVTTQIVVGVLTRLEFLVTFPKTLGCYAEVLEQEWRNYQHIDVTCYPLPQVE